MILKIASLFPHLREVSSQDQSEDDHTSAAVTNEKEKVSVHAQRLSQDFPADQLEKEETLEIREFRDEADRPWWKFFNEFEYRQTKRQSEYSRWYYWFDRGTSEKEKKLLFKLDILIAFYSFVGYWIKYVDSQNLNNAYVSNMEQDLKMRGNDLIDAQVEFTVGNPVFLLPWMFLLPRIPINFSQKFAGHCLKLD